MKKLLPLIILMAGLMVSAFGLIDDAPLKRLVDKIHQQTIHNHQEKLYLHFDRPVYHAGDDAWFKAYLLNAANHKPEKAEKIIYLELINPNGKVVSKKIFKVNEGRCQGTFPLHEDLSSGKYLAVAYTNWMRNAGADFFFKRQIMILNEAESIRSNSLLSSELVNASDNLIDDTLSLATKIVSAPELALQFFPEGGELVAGLNSLVAFEGLNQLGKAMDFEGYIIDDTGQRYAFIKPLKDGKGYFSLKPLAGRQYMAVISGNNGENLRFALPSVRAQGYSMTVTNTYANEEIEVKVMAQAHDKQPMVYLLAMQNGSVKVALQGKINGRSLTFTIPKNKFRTGVVQFTVLDHLQIPRCERLSFINHYDELNIAIQVSDREPNRREAVKVNLQVTDKQGQAIEGDFSMAVSDLSLVPDSLYQHHSLVDYLSISSDIPNVPARLPELLENSRGAHNKMELLMLTNGWRRFNWKACLLDSVPEPSYTMEEGMYVKGQVKKRKSNKPVSKGVEVTMITQGNIVDFYRVKTDEKGQFNFPLFDFNDTVDVVVQTRNKLSYKSDFVVELESNLSFQPVDKGARERMNVEENVATTFFTSDASHVDASAFDRSGVVRAQKERLTDLGLMDTTDIFIQEVEVVSNREKTPKEEMNEFFGAANAMISEKQVEAIAKNTPWHSGLIDLLFDAIPELQVTVNGHDELANDNVLLSGNFERSIDANADDVSSEGSYQAPVVSKEYIHFVMPNKGLHTFYIFIDGQFIGSTDGNGYLNGLQPPLELNDFISMDPATVQSIELRHDLKNHPVQYALSVQSTLEGSPYDLPPAVLSIYTKDGKGLYSGKKKKGVGNLRLFGYTREREFYSPLYDGEADEAITFDKRATLFWKPSVKTDNEGKASIEFYNSDVAQAFRVDVAGMSNSSLPGAKREVFGVVDQALSNNIDADKHVAEIRHKRTSTTHQFTQDKWQRYQVEYAQEHLLIGIVLDEQGQGIAFADISLKDSPIGTTANASGIFALEKAMLANDDIIQISNAGKGYVELSLEQLKNKAMQVTCVSRTDQPSDLSVEQVMKEVYAIAAAKRKDKLQAFEAVYRQMLMKDNLLYGLADFGLQIEQNNVLRAQVPHISNIVQGRVYKTDDYGQAIRWEPLASISNEVVQLIDPLQTLMPFVDKAHRNSFKYRLKGLNTYRGKEVIVIDFEQLEGSYHSFYDGRMLIDSQTNKIMHCEWWAAAAAESFQTADRYIKPGHRYESVAFTNNHLQCSYTHLGDQPVLKHQVEQVELMADGQAIAYSRELCFSQIKIQGEKLKRQALKDQFARRSLINRVSYQPKYWREKSVLLPDFYMMDQVKYLHEIEFYKGNH
ncbi:MG2 domain-containing protein [Carboxylicivirga marina]|uniref:MG2 domain-containing protein n=1 Tax=Carboxylicivirga marina TaxID=2800988 RepID=UPI0025935961|nr:MG2 domain-containing protein [uncultured Carboxylicivirga sp.]